MSEEISKDARKTITKGFWEQTRNFQRLLLIFIIGFPFYIASTTKLVPNYQCTNQTINKTTQSICGVLYDYGDNVPKSFMSNGQAGIEAIAILLLFFSLFTQKQEGRIPIPEAIRIVKAELKKIQTLPTLEGESIEIKNKEIVLPTGVITRYRTDKGEWKCFRYTIGMKIIDVNNREEYYKGMFHPFTGYFDGFVSTDREIKDWDMCSKCGKEYDVFTYTEEDVKRFFDIRKGLLSEK